MSLTALATSASTQVPASTRPVRAIGIDLGTTNSAVAEVLVTPDTPGPPVARCLDVEQETSMGPQIHTLVPSVLSIHDGAVLVGAGAKDLRARVGDFNLKLYRDIFWDCKNDMGVRRSYHKAPVGYRSAKEIAGHLLRHLADAASKGDSPPADSTVVTVPASFQTAQRRDTAEAAKLAGIELAAGALLDEPIAAFVDYVFTHGQDTFAGMDEPRRLVVFDFGGGTCDVAIFELRPPKADDSGGIGVAPLAVSRYHRLGGSDIDRKIAVEILIPQLVKQNELQSRELDYRDKSERVIPALLGCAEALKVGLCREIARLKGFGRYKQEREGLVQKKPGVYKCTLLNKRVLTLQSPTLSAVEFDKVLEPFLERYLLHPRETDHFMTCSVFAPLQDALERAHLRPGDVDLCLPVGGGALIPQVTDAIKGYFHGARILCFDDSEQIQTAVAHGAAWQSLSLAMHGKGLVRPVTGTSINIQSKGGPVELIPDGAELPYPADGDWAESNQLAVPETSLSGAVSLRVELRGGDDRVLMWETTEILPPVSKGDPLRLRYRMDVNQVLHMRLDRLVGDDTVEECQLTVENPLTSVVNPNAKRDELLELEERMRDGALSRRQQERTLERIAELEDDLGRYERALYWLSILNRTSPSAGTLNHMAIIAGKTGDYEQQERFYREAARLTSNWNGPLFNLALLQQRQGRPKEAMDTIDAAIAVDMTPPSLIFKAELVDQLDQPKKARDDLLKRAFAAFRQPSTLADFELFWYELGARLAGDDARQKAAAAERKRRKESSPAPIDGMLPDTRNEIARRPK